MNFPATEEEAREQGYIFAYRTTCLCCGKPIRFFKTPKATVIPINPGPTFQTHVDTCIGLKSLGRGGIVSQVDLDLATFNKRLAVLGLKPQSVERTRQALAELTVEMIECCPGVTMSPDSTFYVKGVLLALLDRAAEFEPMEKGRPQ